MLHQRAKVDVQRISSFNMSEQKTKGKRGRPRKVVQHTVKLAEEATLFSSCDKTIRDSSEAPNFPGVCDKTIKEDVKAFESGGNLLQKNINDTFNTVKKTLMLKDSKIRQLEGKLEENDEERLRDKMIMKNIQCQVKEKEDKLKEVIQEKNALLKNLAEKLNLEIESEREMKEEFSSKYLITNKKVEDLKELIEPLRKKVLEQECLRKERNEANEEKANMEVVNKELRDSLVVQEEAHRNEMSRKDKELIDLKEVSNKLKHDKEVSLKKERKFIDQEKKDIEKVKTNLNRKKEELDEKNQKIEAEFNNLKEQYMLKSEEYLLQIEKQNAEIELLKAKQTDLKKTYDTTEKLKIELRSKDNSLLTLQLENNRHISLLKQKEEDIKDYQNKLDAAGIKDTMKDNHKRIDKLIIKQKQEEIEKLKAELSKHPRKRKRVGSADKSVKIPEEPHVNNLNDCVTELKPIAEVEEEEYSDASTVEYSSPMKVHAIEDSSSNSGENIFASIDKAMTMLRSKRTKLNEVSRLGVQVEGVVGVTEDSQTSRVDKGVTKNLDKEDEEDSDSETSLVIDELDLALASTSREGKTNSDSETDKPKQSAPPLDPLLQPRSESPAQTSQMATTPIIRVRDLDTMCSFFASPDMSDLVIPSSVSDITSDGTDLTPVDMEIVTEIESEQIRKQKEDLNIRILEAETKLKHDVADVVKACINKYYISPRQSVPAEKSFFIRSPEEFSQLAERFSRQFREEVVSEHSQTHSSVEGLLLTQQHKKVIVEQILFYFNVREEVYAKLASLLSPSSARFPSMYRQMTDSLSRQLTDSHLAMSSSGQGLVMTDDHRLCIRQMVDRQGR